MIPVQEMLTWTTDEAHVKVLGVTPPGQTFHIENDRGLWFAWFQSNKDTTVWKSEPSADPRVALFEAYVWVHIGKQEPTDPRWIRGKSDPNKVGPSMGGGSSIPDPEDLDPEEVGNLYHRHK